MITKPKSFFLFILLQVVCVGKVYSQIEHNNSLSENIISLSKIIVNSDKYKGLNDLEIVDYFYNEAQKLTGFNQSESLLLLTLATLPYDEVPIQIPLINLSYRIPLPTLDNDFFLGRRSKIPGIILFESSNKIPDKDKIPHFFGNAFLAYSNTYFNFSKFMGILIELFEATLISGSELDLRDLMINDFGAMFGISIRQNRPLKPSDFIKQYSILFFRLYQ